MRFEKPLASVGVRRPFAAAVGICATVLGLAGAALSVWLVDGRAVSLFAAGLAVAVAVVGFSSWSRAHEKRTGHLVCDGRGVFVDGRCIVERRSVACASVRHDEAIIVHLVGTVHDVEIAVHSEHEARAVLEATSLVQGRFVASLPLYERWTASALGAALSFGLLALCAGDARLLVPSLGALCAVAWGRVRCAAGADGLLLRRAWAPPQMVPHASIVRAICSARELSIELRDGSRLVFAPEAPWRQATMTPAFFDELERRLSRSRAAEASSLVGALTRGERSTTEWLRGVRGLSRPSVPFRAADVPPESLVRVLEDPLVGADVRVAAAAALRTGAEDDRARVRALAEACVSAELRAALTAAIDGDDEDLVAALAPVQGNGRREDRRRAHKNR